MPTNILMPALSPTMETGTLAKWHVKQGDQILAGELLAEIETDKATMEFEAVEDGVITKIFVVEGTKDITVNSPIAEISNDDDSNQVQLEVNQPSNNILKETESADALKAKNSKINKLDPKPSDLIYRTKISPLAKKIATQNMINIKDIQGTGPYGRIIKRDVLEILNLSNQKNDKVDINKGFKTYKRDDIDEPKEKDLNNILDLYKNRKYNLKPLKSVQKIVANRLTQAKNTIPHFYLTRSIQVDKLIKTRLELNASFEQKQIKFSINDFIIKAAAESLQDNPKCNCIWASDNIIELKDSDISVAVAINDGLITPIIRDAQKKSLREISSEMKEKAKKAREKKLLPEEYSGGSFSISNLGMMGVENFDAVINPPQASILAVGSVEKKPLVNNHGQLHAGQVMSVTLSADHRVIDGAVGAVFINSIVDYLSNPIQLLA